MQAHFFSTLKIAIVGLGTVGRGTLDVLYRNQVEIMRRTGIKLEITCVASRNFEKTQKMVDEIFIEGSKPEVLKNIEDVIYTNADVIVELMGGVDNAKDLILKAIEQKKHIVTANKALLANHGAVIFQQAQHAKVLIGFEAAVAGSIPIIKTLREGLTANHIQWVAGIINGTCNYILSEMSQKGLSFRTALAQAQSLGYAEADPSFDIQGVDAAHKLSIISSLAFGTPIQFNQTYIEGIEKITDTDIQYAKELGYTIKLLGLTSLEKTTKNDTGADEQAISLRVHPCLIPQKHMLANVDGSMNAVMVYADAAGCSLYYGRGAGSEPTASAVIADLIDVARSIEHAERIPHLAFQSSALKNIAVLPITEIQSRYYLRLRIIDQTGMMATIASILAKNDISIDVLLQKNHIENDVDVVILTHQAKELNILNALTDLENALGVEQKIKQKQMIRIEYLSN